MNARNFKQVVVNFTRPTNITQYGIADAVAPAVTAILTFADVVKDKAGSGLVHSGWLRKSTNVVTAASFRLHLFNSSVAATADNSPLAIAWADRASYLGHLTFANMLGVVGMAQSVGETIDTVAGVSVPLPFVCGADSRNLYGLLEASAAYTPGNAEQFQVVLVVED